MGSISKPRRTQDRKREEREEGRYQRRPSKAEVSEGRYRNQRRKTKVMLIKEIQKTAAKEAGLDKVSVKTFFYPIALLFPHNSSRS